MHLVAVPACYRVRNRECILHGETKIREAPFFVGGIEFRCQTFKLALECFASNMDRLELDERAELVLVVGQPFDGFQDGHCHSEHVFAE